MPFQSFKDLAVWQHARDLAVEVYRITAEGRLSKDFGLKDQMQRAAVSVPSNIAEGHDRTTDKEFIRYLDISSGSIAELRTQLEIAQKIGYITSDSFSSIDDTCCKIGAMLNKLKQARRARIG